MFTLFASPKKRHFLRRLANAQASIWDKEFQTFQTQEMREMIRLDRDRAQEAADAFRVESENPIHKPETKTELEKKQKIALDNVTRFTAQMKMLDEEVAGRPYVSEEDPGKQGLRDTIASLNELKKMFVSYLKTLR